ncbi:DUF5106 domain-containing protein [Porphyromonas miyakawae]|uniref:DUF5106 domain-containing protein n=1 Tax=Porphyromonas miyakawae TaxID=3137470 RepID=A0ABQ0E319_9PORP
MGKTHIAGLRMTALVWVSCVVLCLVGLSCKGRSVSAQRPLAVDTLYRAYVPPLPPRTLADAEARALWYVKHYWDDCNFYDSQALLAHKELLRKNVEDLVFAAIQLPVDSVAESLVKPLKASDGDLLIFFADAMGELLYAEGRAPKRYEPYYLPILKELSVSAKVDLARSERAKFLYKMLSRNSLGSHAEGFLSVDTLGQMRSLKSFEGKPALMIFFAPGCEHCRKMTKKIERSRIIRQLVTSGELALLYVYPFPYEDIFLSGVEELPSFTTYYGYNKDGRILRENLYNIEETPVLYMLNKEGVVLLKNASFEELEQFLKNDFKAHISL